MRQKGNPSGCLWGAKCQYPEPALSDAETAALNVFLDSMTQWRWVSGMAVSRAGLDFAAVESVARAHGLAWTWPLLRRVQICERTLLEYDRLRNARSAQAEENARAAGIVN